MTVINPEKAYNRDFRLTRLFAMEQRWQTGTRFEMKNPRKNSAVLYLLNGKITYFLEDGSNIEVNEGNVIYLPKGSVYTSYFTDEKNGVVNDYLLEFQEVDEEKGDFVLFDTVTTLKIRGIEDSFKKAVASQQSPTFSVVLMKSIAFEIVYRILRSAKNLDLQNSSSFSSISKGIIYMETDVLQEKSISEIAEMCNVCESGFRSLFKQYCGQSPVEYRISVKIEKAKAMLLSGNAGNREISESLGFSDESYFCKLFKRKTGLTPKEFAKQHSYLQ